MNKNIFVVGLDDFNLKILKRIKGSSNLCFHPLLDYWEIRGSDEYPVEDLIKRCENRLNRFEGSIDGIIGYFDFPSTDIVPIICKKYNLPAASIESVMKCENKLWARMEQAKIIKDHIPSFTGFNPRDFQGLDKLDMSFPFWIKPIRSFKSYLAFNIIDDNAFLQGFEKLKNSVHKITDPFRILLGYAQIPDDFKPFLDHSCIAESLLTGNQCTVEGYVYNGEVICYGIVDSIRDEDRSPFIGYVYPSRLPEYVKNKIIDLSTKVMTHLQYDNATFNIEYFYNPVDDSVCLLEINPRCSQSHAHLFEKVDGVSNLSVMVDLALGRRPEFKKGDGRFNCAAKYMVRVYEDGIITKIPWEKDIEQLKKRIPDAEIKILADVGTRLSKLENQDSYSYELMDIFIGAKSLLDLAQRYDTCLNMLPFSMDLKFRRPKVRKFL
ncbi:MAG: D-alanine--D-alanine ligase [Thermodesulfobacteriota bacterium]